MGRCAEGKAGTRRRLLFNGLFFCLLAALVLGEVNDAVVADLAVIAVTYLAVDLPAGLGIVDIGRAFLPPDLGAVGEFPAGGVFKEFLDALDADLLIVDKLADAAYPFDIVLGIVAVLVAAGRGHKAVLFIEPQGLVGRADKLRYDTDWVKRDVLLFFFAYFFFKFSHLIEPIC